MFLAELKHTRSCLQNHVARNDTWADDEPSAEKEKLKTECIRTSLRSACLTADNQPNSILHSKPRCNYIKTSYTTSLRSSQASISNQIQVVNEGGRRQVPRLPRKVTIMSPSDTPAT